VAGVAVPGRTDSECLASNLGSSTPRSVTCCVSAHIVTTWRSGAAGPFSSSPRVPSLRSLRGWCSRQTPPGSRIIIRKFRDGFLPHEGREVKEAFEELKEGPSPDLILTHYRGDLHQDHRLISELTWNTFRNHLILEYEIPKYDGDLGTPNVFVPVDEPLCQRKIDTILENFASQAGKRWFTPEVFRALLRLRGMECNSPSDYAEAFYCRKLVVR
jgi:hypothetical protein